MLPSLVQGIYRLPLQGMLPSRNSWLLVKNRQSYSLDFLALKLLYFCFLGGGLMGAGIAQVGAQTGHKVTLVDVSQDVLDKSQARISESIKRVAKKKFKDDAAAGDKFIAQAIGQLQIATNPDEALSTADLVVEAVTENLDLKLKLFKAYDQVAPAKTIFASNTSSLSIRDIANATPNRLDRFGGLHFFNPVPVMKLLEVCIHTLSHLLTG